MLPVVGWNEQPTVGSFVLFQLHGVRPALEEL